MKARGTFKSGTLSTCLEVVFFFCPFLDFMQMWNRCYGLELNKVSESRDVIVRPSDWLWVVLFSFTFSDPPLSSTPPPPDLHVKVKAAKPICVSPVVRHRVNVTLNYSEVSAGLDRHGGIGCEQVKVSYRLCWINNVTGFRLMLRRRARTRGCCRPQKEDVKLPSDNLFAAGVPKTFCFRVSDSTSAVFLCCRRTSL